MHGDSSLELLKSWKWDLLSRWLLLWFLSTHARSRGDSFLSGLLLSPWLTNLPLHSTPWLQDGWVKSLSQTAVRGSCHRLTSSAPPFFTELFKIQTRPLVPSRQTRFRAGQSAICHMSSDLQCVGGDCQMGIRQKRGGSYEHSQRNELIFSGDKIPRLTPDPAGDFEKLLASGIHP